MFNLKSKIPKMPNSKENANRKVPYRKLKHICHITNTYLMYKERTNKQTVHITQQRKLNTEHELDSHFVVHVCTTQKYWRSVQIQMLKCSLHFVLRYNET